jgi:phenylacetate-CoA ligase
VTRARLVDRRIRQTERVTATRALSRARGTLTVLRHLPGQRRAQGLPLEHLAARRDARIRALVRHAAATVPHYRDLDPDAMRSAADLDHLPLVDKSAVQADPDRFRSESRRGRDAVRLRTTGSTALPLTVFHDRASLLANLAYSERERAVEAHFVGRRYGYRVVDVRAPAGTVGRVQSFYAEATFRPGRPQRRPLSVEMSPEEVLAAIERLRPAVVRSYGGYLELLFRVAAAKGTLRHRPRAVLYSGDTMSDPGRELIASGFGIPVLSKYNAVECFKIAFTCEEGTGFHLHEDLCHVRLVHADGRPCAPGEKGEVVLSNLMNHGTVLLNYRLGDLARLTDEPCPCGRSTRRLLDLEGRVDEFFELAGGSYVYPTEVWRLFRERPEILRYQLVQHDRDRFELRTVTSGPDDADDVVAGVVAVLRALLRGAQVAPTRVGELAAGPGGKFRHLVPLARHSGSEPARDAG